MSNVHAPYNFVPFSESVILPYTDIEQLPKHNLIAPNAIENDGRGKLKTGEIHVTITAQTPILVAMQEKEQNRKRETETHAYAQRNGRTYILPGSTIRGMVRENMQILGFGAVCPNDDMRDLQISGHYLHEGLPARHQELSKAKLVLDYPRAILGYADPRTKESFRSRVSFENLECCNESKTPLKELGPIKAVLGQPRPEWYPGYVCDGKSYTEVGFRLRGYKQYWLKEFEMDIRSGKTNVATFMHPLPAGISFCGVIRYKDLYEDELGLLLWSLRLEKGQGADEDCYQSLGMGKPYGFGRVKLDIDELWEFDMENLYSFDGLGSNVKKFGKHQVKRNRRTEHPVDTEVDRYIKTYQNYALKKLKEQTAQRSGVDEKKESEYQSLLEYPEIKDFFFLHRVQKDVISSYMSWKQYQDTRAPLPSTADIREEQEAKKVNHLPADESMESMLAALQKKINSKRL